MHKKELTLTLMILFIFIGLGIKGFSETSKVIKSQINKGKVVTDWKTKQKKTYTGPELRKKLDKVSYDVLLNEGTERSGTSPLDKNYEPGIYVEKLSGEPLYLSIHKFNSGTGWPSFYDSPFKSSNLVRKVDNKLFGPRVEIRSKLGDNHLGHVFEDGPAPTGLRYCMNGASLRFIHINDMEKEGYGEFIKLIKESK